MNRANIVTINDKDIYMNELIGEGKFAKVYYACDHPEEEAKLGEYTPDFRYACKVFTLAEMSQNLIEEIYEEIANQSDIICENTTKVVRSVVEKDKIYMFQELANGMDLAQL